MRLEQAAEEVEMWEAVEEAWFPSTRRRNPYADLEAVTGVHLVAPLPLHCSPALSEVVSVQYGLLQQMVWQKPRIVQGLPP